MVDVFTQADRDTLNRAVLTQGWFVQGRRRTSDQPGLPAGQQFPIVPFDAAEDRIAWLDVERRRSEMATRAMLRAVAGRTTTARKVLVLGDSIAVGIYGGVDIGGFRAVLPFILDEYDVAAAVVTDAASGSTIDSVKSRLAGTLAAHPDVAYVVLHVGTNDSAWSDLTGWQGKYLAVIDQALAVNATVRMVCGAITISDESSDPRVANPNLPAQQTNLNSLIRGAVAARPGGRVALADHAVIPSTWLLDGGWHPGRIAYSRMARIIVDAMRPWLP